MSEPITQGSTYRGEGMPGVFVAVRKERTDNLGELWTLRCRSVSRDFNGIEIEARRDELRLIEAFVPPVSRQEKNAGRASRAGQVKAKKAI